MHRAGATVGLLGTNQIKRAPILVLAGAMFLAALGRAQTVLLPDPPQRFTGQVQRDVCGESVHEHDEPALSWTHCLAECAGG